MRRANLLFARRERRFLGAAADMQVGARFARAGTRLMAPANSPSTRMMRLSPLRTCGHVALHHQRLAEEGGEELDQGVEILVARRTRKTPWPPLP